MNIVALSVLDLGFLKGPDFDFFIAGRAIIDLEVNDIVILFRNSAEYRFKIVGIEMRRKRVDRIPGLYTGGFFLKNLDDYPDQIEKGMKLNKPTNGENMNV